jgi:hypothetical protein
MYNPIELPSIQEIEELDRQRQNAIESLQLSDNGNSVKCQSCGTFIAIVGKLYRLHPKRIIELKSQIRWTEQYFNHHGGDKAELLKEEESKELLRRLPLYSAHMTGYKYICSKCWDKAYLLDQERRKKERTN